MPVDLQGHLLRFLQDGQIVRVGGRETINVDVRIVAATNVRLRQAIAEGRFREDLYYRLNILALHMPPLRDRPEDIAQLARHFLREAAAISAARSVDFDARRAGRTARTRLARQCARTDVDGSSRRGDRRCAAGLARRPGRPGRASGG